MSKNSRLQFSFLIIQYNIGFQCRLCVHSSHRCSSGSFLPWNDLMKNYKRSLYILTLHLAASHTGFSNCLTCMHGNAVNATCLLDYVWSLSLHCALCNNFRLDYYCFDWYGILHCIKQWFYFHIDYYISHSNNYQCCFRTYMKWVLGSFIILVSFTQQHWCAVERTELSQPRYQEHTDSTHQTCPPDSH